MVWDVNFSIYPTSDDTIYWGLVNSNPHTTVRHLSA